PFSATGVTTALGGAAGAVAGPMPDAGSGPGCAFSFTGEGVTTAAGGFGAAAGTGLATAGAAAGFAPAAAGGATGAGGGASFSFNLTQPNPNVGGRASHKIE